jgi:hypothetical protein
MISVSSANGRVLGFDTPPAMFANGSVGDGGPYDGIVTLNSTKNFQFTRPTDFGKYDALRAIEHEMDEVMGFGSSLDDHAANRSPQDLFSWSSPGVRNITTSGSRYFSIDQGNTNIVNFNQDSSGDLGDWLSDNCPNPVPGVQDAFECPGQQADLTATSPEGINLDVIGYDLGTPTASKADFNGDGRSDIVWQNNSTGNHAIWLMNGTAYSSGVTVPGAPTAWQIVGNGDFNSDGKTDIIWDNSSTGECAIWFFSGTSYLGGSGVFTTIPPPWQIATIGDFNGDGKPDIVWQNTATGDRGIWLMNGTSHIGTTQFQVAAEWRIVGTGDFNGDSKTDILWQNSSTGECAIWFMNGTSYIGGSGVFATVPTEWHIAGTGNFNNDGNTDIVWQNILTGERAIWVMNGFTISSGVSLGVAPVEWEIRNH